MYVRYGHNIYLLFLSPHASRVLQPLDLSVFDPINSHYRTTIVNLIYAKYATRAHSRPK